MSNSIGGVPYAPYPSVGYNAAAGFSNGYAQVNPGYPQAVYAPDAFQASYGYQGYPGVAQPGYPMMPQPGYQAQAANPFAALASMFSGLLSLFRKPKAPAAVPAAVAAPAPVALPTPAAGMAVSPTQAQQPDADFVTGVYRQVLGREPDAAGLNAWLQAMHDGMPRQTVINAFMASPEYQQRVARGQMAPSSPAMPGTVPARPWGPFGSEAELETAVQYAAKQALDEQISRNGGFLANNCTKDQENKFYYDTITMVIGQLRLRGLEVERLARHTSNPIGNPRRYVNDAIVLPDGRAIDLYGGDGTEVTFHDLQVPSPKTDRNTAITDPSLPPSSSTLGL